MFQIRNMISNKKQKKEVTIWWIRKKQKKKNGDKYNIPMLEKLWTAGATYQVPERVNHAGNSQPAEYTQNDCFPPAELLLNMGYLSKHRYPTVFPFQNFKTGSAALGESNIVEQSFTHERCAIRSKKYYARRFMENRIVLLEQVLGSHNFTFLLRPGTSFCLHASPPANWPSPICRKKNSKKHWNDTIYRLQQTYYRKRSSTEKSSNAFGKSDMQ